MTFTVIAFKKYNFQKGIWGSEFIGFDNFKSLFSTRDSWIILRNTVGYNLIFIAIGLFVGLAIAILLDELNSKKREARLSDDISYSLYDIHYGCQLYCIRSVKYRYRVY